MQKTKRLIRYLYQTPTRGMSLVGILFVFCLLFTIPISNYILRSNNIPVAHAATSSNLNFQARLLSAAGNTVPDGNYHLEFKLYDGGTQGGPGGIGETNAGSLLWTETRTTGNLVRVVNGYFSVNLGSVTAFPGTINWDQEHWLTINVGGSGGAASWDGEMLAPGSKRTKLTAVPYAFKAAVAANVSSNNTNSTTTHSAAVTLQSGNALGATSNSGSVSLDSGTATGTAGTISIGTANTSGITIGRATVTTILQGNLRFSTLNCTSNTNGGALTADASGNISCSDDDGGGGGTLQAAYNADADGSDAIITLTSTDGSLLVRDASTPLSTIFGVQSNDGLTSYLTVAAATTTVGNNLLVSGTTTSTGNLVVGTGATSNSTLQIIGNTSFPTPTGEGHLFYHQTNNQMYVYDGTRWQADRSSSTKIVGMGAPAGCTGTVPVASLNYDAADYVVNSCADADATINAAITSLGGQGGTVYLMEGTYIIDSTITMASNVTLVGAGEGTTIKFANTVSTNIRAITGSSINNVTISNLRMDGNKANIISTQDAIFMNNVGSGNGATAVTGLKVDKVTIQNFRSNGVNLGGTSANSSVTNNVIRSNLAHGINDTSSGNNTFKNNLVQANDRGVYLTSTTYDTVSANTVESNTQAGVYVSGGSNTVISDNKIRNNGAGNATDGGIFASGGSYATITGNTLTTNNGFGIYIAIHHSTVSGNTVSGSTEDGIGISADYLTITGNTVSSGSSNGISGGGGNQNATITGNTVTLNVGRGILWSGTSSSVSSNVVTDNTNIGINIGTNGASNIVANNRITNTLANTSDSIDIGLSANDAQIIGNQITDLIGTGCAIDITSSSLRTYIADNTYSGASASGICDSAPSGSTIYANQMNSNNSIVIQGPGSVNVGSTTAGNGTLSVTGAYYGSQIATPSAPTVTRTGALATGTWGYRITALDGVGETLPSAQTTRTNSTTLDGSNFNTITWDRVPGATSYKIYRTLSGGTPSALGLICTVLASSATMSCVDNPATVSTVVLAPPIINTTGGGFFSGQLIARSTTNTAGQFQIQNSNGSVLFGADTNSSITNLVTNSSFETGTTGWTAVQTGTVINQDPNQYYNGTKSLNITTTATTNAGAKFTTGNGANALIAGQPYSVSWYDKLASGTFTDVTAAYSRAGSTADEANSPCSNYNTQTVTTTGWTRHTCTLTASVGTVSPSAYIIIKQAAGTARTFYIDAVQVEAGSTATGYNNGSIQIDGTLTLSALGSNTGAVALCRNSTNQIASCGVNSAGVTLQHAYDASTNPEIIVDSTRGALTVQDAAAGLGSNANLLEVKSGDGLVTYLAVKAGNATGGFVSGQNGLTQNLTNVSSTGGTVNGYNQTITVANTSSASTTNGFNLAVMDNTSLANTNKGINISVGGSGTNQLNIGADIAVSNGTGLRVVSSNAGTGGNIACGNTSFAALAICADGGTNSPAIYGTTSASGSQITSVTGTGVTGANSAGGTAGDFYKGIIGRSLQSAAAAYTSVGVFGNATGGPGATAYAGYFTLKNSSATLGAAIYASNDTVSANILQLQDNATDVFTVANGGAITAKNETDSSAAFRIQSATTSDTLFTTNTTSNRVVIGNGTGTDTDTTLLVVDSASADPTTNSVEGAIYYNSSSDKFRCFQGIAWTDCIGAGGASSTLQSAYVADTDDNVDATISLTADDDSLTILNPSSSGTSSSYTFRIQQQSTGAVEGLRIESAGSSNLLTVRDTTATAADVFTIANGGDATFKSQTNSATAVQVQRSNSDILLKADTTNNRLIVGNATASAGSDSTLFVVDAAPTTFLPTGVNGGIIYDSTVDKFKIYENGAYKEVCNKVDQGCGANSGTTTLQEAYNNSSSPATITTTATAKGILLKAGSTFDSTSLFQVQNAAGSSLFNVDSKYSNITLNGLNSGELAGPSGTWNTNSYAIGCTTPGCGSPTERDRHSSVVANGYVYVIGGHSNISAQTNIIYAKLNADGSTGAWSINANSLPTSTEFHSSVVANGYVYVIGGSGVSTVYYAKLNADGSTGAWATNANALPANRSVHSSVVANGYVYVIGGDSLGAQSTVYYAKLNADGSTGAWATNSYAIGCTTPGCGSPIIRASHSSVVANGYVYVIGGGDNVDNRSTVYYAKLNADGSTGAWSTNANALPDERAVHTSVIANGYVYVIAGGGSFGALQSTVYYAKLNADGSTGAWSTNANAVPSGMGYHTSIIANGYVYMIGGNNGTIQSTVYYASTSRIKLGGALDLVSLGGANLADGETGTGGELTAGNTNIVGLLQVQGTASFVQNASFNQDVSIAQGLVVGAAATGTNTKLQVGSATTDGVAVLLVLDSYNNGTDPTGTNGAIYYNSSLSKFRCYENSAWKDCLPAERYVYKTGDQGTTSVTYIDISGLTMPVVANTNYRYECSIMFSSGATANGYAISATAPTSPTAFGGQFYGGISQAGNTLGGSSWGANDGNAGAVATSAHAGSGNMVYVTGILRNGANSGNLQMRWRNEVATSTHTIQQGSYCKYAVF